MDESVNKTAEVAKNLRDCLLNVTTASLKERKELFKQKLIQCIENEGFQEVQLKGVSKIIILTLFRYSDNFSRYLVLNFISKLLDKYGLVMAKYLLVEMYAVAVNLSKYSACLFHASSGLTLLTWCGQISKIYYPKRSEDESMLKPLIEVEILSYSAVCSFKSRRADRVKFAAVRCLNKKIQKLEDVLEYLNIILKSEKFQIQSLYMLDYIFNFLKNQKATTSVTPEMKKALINMFMKNCIQTKVKVAKSCLEHVAPFLKYLSHDDFLEILPIIQKSLLRNPETILEAVSYLLLGLSIDLSRYIEDLSKCVCSHLISQNMSLRSDAVFTVETIVKQCSDSSAIEFLLTHLLQILSGSEGKLALPEQRSSVLLAILSVSKATLSSNHMESLANIVYKDMFPCILQEGHEGTLLQALTTMKTWCKYFVSDLPPTFVQSIKTGVGAKNCTIIVRANYFQVASEAIKGNTLLKGLGLLETLLQTVEKSKSQSHAVNNVYEAIVASSLLARMAVLDDVPEAKFDGFWNTILDPVKKPLIGEKFLAALQMEHLQQLVQFVNSLFTNHHQRVIKKGMQPWYQVFVLLLLYPDYNSRNQVKALITKMIDSGNCDTVDFQKQMFHELHKVVSSYHVDMENTNDTTKCVPLKRFVSTYHFIALCGKKDESQSSETLMNCLMELHHPTLFNESKVMLFDMANALDIDMKKFVSEKKDALSQIFMDMEVIELMHYNALNTLLSVLPEDLLSVFMEYLRVSLANSAYINVTSNDVGIMKTAEGEVYDQSVYESAKAAEQKKTNVKRESKAYSYKEQKIEMELREELKKKKPQENKLELTPKQKEQLQNIMTSEREIRCRLKDLEKLLIKQVMILNACLDTDVLYLNVYYLDLMNMLLRLCNSLLAAPCVIPSYLKLSQCIFKGEQKVLGEFVGNVILRCMKAPYKLPCGWAEEDQTEQIKRLLHILHTFATERNVALLMTYTRKKPFSAPAFAYSLPFLKTVLKDRGAAVGMSEALRMKALQLIMIHSKLRANTDNLMDENGPELLPCSEMLQILSQVIIHCDGNNKDGKIQKYANTVFDEVCKAASGDIGCTMATVSEIEQLLGNLFSPCTVLRNASLKGLLEIVNILPTSEDSMWDYLTHRIMIARYDVSEENAELAASLWEQASMSISSTMTRDLVHNVTHPLTDIRLAACKGLATSLGEHPEISAEIFFKLLEIYEENTQLPIPIIDNLGRVVSAPYVDPWECRQGVGLALEKCVSFTSKEMLEVLFRFFVPSALGDRDEKVRKQMLDAAMEYVNTYGEEHMSILLSIFDEFLDGALDSSEYDAIRQSVIILTGSLAKHLEKTDPKIKPIFSKLMSALATPSQSVQKAVAECLPPLCAAMKTEAPELIKELLHQLLESDSYGERMGAAYGLAGLVKGLGILTLKQQNIISTLNDAIQDKKIWKHREGALFAFETLCTMLGRLFEPYVVHLLPHLLLCFGDGNQYVREAADETAKAVMRNLSNHGVKLVLPSLLKALEEESWRTKTGSAELLGAMSFCAPKQLSSCLPSIVPKLTEVLADSHIKVQKAGQQALRQIGGVIRNPEIQEISPIILDALADPKKNVVACLEGLLSTSFVHFIDAPSLSLIMPTLEKALELRATETKKMAAQILGNMYALTDAKDLSPYLPSVVPGLKKSLLDPSPEVRAVSARALGATVKGMGKDCFDDLMPWLLETLTSEISSVDRSGAAQGLSEVLFALGQERLDNLMPDVISTTMKTDLAPNVRDGYLMLYIYLPATYGDDFMSYIGPIIPSILKGLADESEYVRETSLKAGQRIISMYSDTAIELLLPQLEAGLFDEHWRIRYSSVQLLGDLLFRLSGVTGKQTTVGDEDDNFGTAHSAQIILETLGHERRDRVYAGLYMGRSDVALAVRQAALHVWKVIVQNTAKTLREILPVLFELLLGCLASQNYDKRQVAARSLGDLVRKLGERILPEIIPILEAGLSHEDGNKRQGVCIGLSEIMDSTSRDMIIQFEESLITTVRKALVDVLPDVRQAAAETFVDLHNTIGHRVLDGVLLNVFKQLDDPTVSEYALDGLKQVMAVKSKSVLPYLVPKLTTPPVNTKALAILSSVAGEALIKHLEKILPAMFQAINCESKEDQMAFEGTKTLILSVQDDIGVHTIIDELVKASKDQNPAIRKVAANLLAMFCKETRGDYSQYVQQLFRCFIQIMNDVDEEVYAGGWSALDALVKHLDPSEQLQHLHSLRQAIKYIKDEVRSDQLPGFCIVKKGIIPILPIFREGMLNGPQETKEQTATVLGEIIKLTSAAALKPSVVHITGPLIRILGDRFNSTVKVAILDTLGLLLDKVGIMLKPFLPQLQTTFVKALNDPTLAVREKAAWALGLLTILHTRVDSLFTELKNGINNTEDNAIRETILQALRTITLKAGSKMGEVIRVGLLETLQELLDYPEDGVRVYAGSALGALCQVLPEEEIKQLLNDSLLDVNPTIDWTSCHGRAVALSYALFDAPSKLFDAVDENEIVDTVVQHSCNDRVPVCTYGVHSLGHLLMFSKEEPDAAPTIVISSFKKNLSHTSTDVKIAALQTLKYLAKNTPEVVQFDTMRYIIPDFTSLLRDRNPVIRSSAELTLAFVLQLHKNDTLFDACVANIAESSNFLQEYRKNSFQKLSDSLATDINDYKFVT